MSTEAKTDRSVHRRILLEQIKIGRGIEADLLRQAEDLKRLARETRADTEGIVKRLAEFDRGAGQ